MASDRLIALALALTILSLWFALASYEGPVYASIKGAQFIIIILIVFKPDQFLPS